MLIRDPRVIFKKIFFLDFRKHEQTSINLTNAFDFIG